MFRAATSQAMTTHAFCDACLLEKIAMQMSFGSKFFQILHHVLDPKMGVEKWTQKWCQNLTPKMGVQKWHPKGGPKMAPKKLLK